jgi:hypothetical protein
MTQSNNNGRIAVFDLDGCVSNDSWRLGLIPHGASKSEDFHAYHERCAEDDILPVGAQLVMDHYHNGDFIMFATARPGEFAEVTSQWIQRNFRMQPVEDFTILMRGKDDHRQSADLKREMVQFIKNFAKGSNRKVVIACDDRKDVVDMYAEEGFPAKIVNANGVIERQEPPAPVVQYPVGVNTAPEARLEGQMHIDGQPVSIAQLREAHLRLLASQNKQPVGLHSQDSASSAKPVFDPSKVLTRAQLLDTVGKPSPEELLKSKDAAAILERAAATYRERNAGYKDNAVMVGQIMEVLFPHGVTIRTANDHHVYHLFELMIVKLTRFVKSDLTHEDSIHDLSVYAAMVEALVSDHDIEVRDQYSDDCC